MEYTAKLPTEVGLYRHRWDFRGQMREQVLFTAVGVVWPYTRWDEPREHGCVRAVGTPHVSWLEALL